MFNSFREKRTEIITAVDSLADLKTDARREVKNYIEEFYSTIGRQAGVKRFFIDHCNKTAM